MSGLSSIFSRSLRDMFGWVGTKLIYRRKTRKKKQLNWGNWSLQKFIPF
jgi:hypothetical protein